MDRPLRAAVVGVSFGAAVHIPGLQSEGIEVVGVCARRPERAQEAADRFGIANVFTDYAAMLQRDDIDAVSIVTPEPLHYEMTVAALEAGKHVLCEKPFTSNQALAREMWDRAQGSGLTAMIAHEFRFSSARMRTKELLDEGYIGTPKLAIMRLITGGGRRPAAAPTPPVAGAPARAGNGFLWSLGSHYIDCLRHWFGEVESVSGDVANLRQGASNIEYDADDTFLFTLRFTNGVLAHMIASRGLPFGSGPGVEVYGSEGALFTPQGSSVSGGGSGVNPPAHGTILGGRTGEDEKLKELPIPERLEPFADERDDRLMPFRLLAREFVRGIDEGTSPAPNFYDGWRCQQVLDAVRESSLTGRRVHIVPAE